MNIVREARARLAPLGLAVFVPTLLALTGCGVINGQAAANQGKSLPGQAIDKGKQAGGWLQNFALTSPHLAASLLIAVLGTIGIRFLFKSAQVKYLLVIAVTLFIGYVVFGPGPH